MPTDPSIPSSDPPGSSKLQANSADHDFRNETADSRLLTSQHSQQHQELEMASDSQECQAEACAIQSCIQRNNYNEARCTDVIRKLYTCCAAMYERDPEAKSTTCPLEKMVQRKLKQLDSEK